MALINQLLFILHAGEEGSCLSGFNGLRMLTLKVSLSDSVATKLQLRCIPCFISPRTDSHPSESPLC